MKPIVLYDIEKYDGDENLLLISKEVFNKLLEDVYNAGLQDANKGNHFQTYSGVRSPILPVEITSGMTLLSNTNQ